ncbi:Alpha/Beta hydrolase protein [Aspergillus navahoensis]
MALQYDPTYGTTSAPLHTVLRRLLALLVGEVQGRRQLMDSVLNARPAPTSSSRPVGSDVSRTIYRIPRSDGSDLTVIGYKKALAERGVEHLMPAILHLLGGGMIMGSAEQLSLSVESHVRKTGITIFDVDYRLAPKHPAGGGIAAGIALMARDRRVSPLVAKQILIYPMLDDHKTKPTPLLEDLATWSSSDKATGWRSLLGSQAGGEGVSPYAAPARATDLARLPTTYIEVGVLDIFRDEDMAYAAILAQAGGDTEFHLWPGVPHIFDMIPTVEVTQTAVQSRWTAMKSF